eukprot:30997-Pelagococcus_subviridis.AAC.2
MLVTSWVNRADGTVQWQPGMEVHVKHMKRKDVPAWAIPDSGKEGKEEARTPADPKAAAAANERAAAAAAAAAAAQAAAEENAEGGAAAAAVGAKRGREDDANGNGEEDAEAGASAAADGEEPAAKREKKGEGDDAAAAAAEDAGGEDKENETTTTTTETAAAAIEVPEPVDHDDDIAGLGGTHDEIGGDVGERAAAKAKAPGDALRRRVGRVDVRGACNVNGAVDYSFARVALLSSISALVALGGSPAPKKTKLCSARLFVATASYLTRALSDRTPWLPKAPDGCTASSRPCRAAIASSSWAPPRRCVVVVVVVVVVDALSDGSTVRSDEIGTLAPRSLRRLTTPAPSPPTAPPQAGPPPEKTITLASLIAPRMVRPRAANARSRAFDRSFGRSVDPNVVRDVRFPFDPRRVRSIDRRRSASIFSA